MSEQTPETESGMADGQDPSMEDILASIRKIIAEDDVQAPAVADDVILEVAPDVPSLDGDVAELGHVETLDLDIIAEEIPAIDSDIEALIGEMDATASDDMAPSLATEANLASEPLEDILDLEIPMDETEALAEVETKAQIDLVETEALTLEDELIDLVAEAEPEIVESNVVEKPEAGLVDGAMAAMGLSGPAATAKIDEDVVADEEDELSLMLDNMLEDSASYQENPPESVEDRVIDPAEELVTEDVAGDDILAELGFIEDAPEDAEVISKSDPDIDLVKSLMADLTEEPLHDDAESAEALPEVTAADIDDLDVSTDDIMDEILSITIDDETKLSEEIAIPEISAPSVEEVPGETMSLKDIAAAAKADAEASEGDVSVSAVASLATAGVVSAAVANVTGEAVNIEEPQEDSDDVDMALSQLDDVLAELDMPAEENSEAEPELITPENPIEETPEMAGAKKTDAIIDEVTETATAGAFASLNQVVEEKATVAERGDRIGDLVMEALQPMLKEWLDANLKGIVERAVTKEVKRISSGK